MRMKGRNGKQRPQKIYGVASQNAGPDALPAAEFTSDRDATEWPTDMLQTDIYSLARDALSRLQASTVLPADNTREDGSYPMPRTERTDPASVQETASLNQTSDHGHQTNHTQLKICCLARLKSWIKNLNILP